MGFETDDAVRPDSGAMERAGREVEAVAGVELDGSGFVEQFKGDRAFDAVENLDEVVAVRFVEVAGWVPPGVWSEALGGHESSELALRDGYGWPTRVE